MGILRIILALSVVLAHLGGIFGYKGTGGEVSVEIFFVISGFFMEMILTEKYSSRKDTLLFYSNRALRIFTTYAFALSIAIAITLSTVGRPHNVATAYAESDLHSAALAAALLSNVIIFGQDAFLFLTNISGNLSLLSIHAQKPDMSLVDLMLIPPAWSIALELTFYAIAPYLHRLKTRNLILFSACLLAARAFFGAQGAYGDPWSYRLFPFELPIFVVGMLSYRLSKSAPSIARSRALGLTLIAFCAFWQGLSFVAKHYGIPYWVPKFSLVALCAAALPGLFSLTASSRIDKYIAEYSFPLYLVHYPIIRAYDGIMEQGSALNNDVSRIAVCITLSLAAAWASVHFVDTPINAYRAARFKRQHALATADKIR